MGSRSSGGPGGRTEEKVERPDRKVDSGGAGTVGGVGVEGPGRVGEGGAAGGGAVLSSWLFADANQLDGAVYRGQDLLLGAAPLASRDGGPGSIGCSGTSLGY